MTPVLQKLLFDTGFAMVAYGSKMILTELQKRYEDLPTEKDLQRGLEIGESELRKLLKSSDKTIG